jgi:hypothetical protein
MNNAGYMKLRRLPLIYKGPEVARITLLALQDRRRAAMHRSHGITIYRPRMPSWSLDEIRNMPDSTYFATRINNSRLTSLFAPENRTILLEPRDRYTFEVLPLQVRAAEDHTMSRTAAETRAASVVSTLGTVRHRKR